ncbi:MAG: hypoxanthine phosphoribosyltransferase [Candidatus Geothermincolia bacterium]
MGESIELLYTRQEIEETVRELAYRITQDYAGREPVLVGILKGAFVMMADLCRLIDLPVEVDFIAVSSYGQETHSSGVVRIIKDLDLDIEGRDVILVEDIVDTGLTLSYLVDALATRNPASLEVCTLLNKPGARQVDFEPRYCGFEIPHLFVVGYGLDQAERFRHLPYIGFLSEERAE